MSITWLRRISIGLRRSSKWKIIAVVFLAYSVGWTILEPFISLAPEHLLNKLIDACRIFIFVFSIGYTLWQIARPTEVLFEYKTNRVRIVFGDLFAQKGIKVIPVSRYMHETAVIKNSLQYLMIKNLTGHPPTEDEKDPKLQPYLDKLNQALVTANVRERQRQGRPTAEKYYALGTSTILKKDDEQYLIVAVTETELRGHIESDNCSVTDLWIALEKMWVKAQQVSHGNDVNIPLLGGGITGITLPAAQLLDLNLLAIMNALVKAQTRITSGEIRIVLHHSYFEEIDLSSVKFPK